ncbi:helix-turn-helix domain-containing protein [Vaginisenegalia massiliensis]|uniref:helix-turn-helix domain-containing protein n=1 Tax=Vaginisenegalia massiliensis TaxID=2058294 RepID=UPI000F53E8CD|nr:helix-turn-helix domain-containing protein [Vaginisenegalia massiliensis]
MEEELLTKTELCRKVLNCDYKTAEAHFINKKGFPFVRVGKRKKFPKNKVIQWLDKQIQYN